ncbi:MAG: hypothetical protein ACPF8S_06850 [Schleiferiaceae bacterium]|jgi:di/tricarboxylate transporter
MKRLAIIIVVLLSLLSFSLTANERVELPTKPISLIFIEDIPDIRLVIHQVDSTENEGNLSVIIGVVEAIGGCGILYVGSTAVFYGSIVHLFRPEDRREWLSLYSAGTVGTALGLVVIDDGLKRTGLKGLFRSRSSGTPGVYFSE